ncbi:sterol desaturase family protein [Sphingomonas sp. 28-63-12]|uniref:sterol desaturase family protein n=1 Tax=Sphingomonas sp. 28-63-12 TaxID=1970434 RepID=UPI000BD317CB|nr:MAG: sterol desaturase [Sphingomonas sp. 28-63-12]
MDVVLSVGWAVAWSAASMTLIVGVRYLIVSGAFAAATRFLHPGLYAGLDRQIRREIGWSLASAAIYGVPAGILAWGWQAYGWTQIYTDIAAYPVWYWPLSVLIYLFAHDSWFYWTHRWMHRPRPFRLAHAVHHASRPPTAWAAMAFHPIEAITGAVVIPLLILLIPIHLGALALVLAVMTVMGVTNHMGWEVFPRFIWGGPLGAWLITASHHQRHHSDYRCNYGLYFRFWDHVCGTDHGIGGFAKSPGGGPSSSDRAGPALRAAAGRGADAGRAPARGGANHDS